jgi:hypothetical protein
MKLFEAVIIDIYFVFLSLKPTLLKEIQRKSKNSNIHIN